jgi:hypothetical protein
MILEAEILLGIEHFQERRGWIAANRCSSCRHRRQEDQLGAGFLDHLNDLAGSAPI